jgi:hypothetical protein
MADAETWEDVPAVPAEPDQTAAPSDQTAAPAPDQTAPTAPTQTAPAEGSEGRTVTVHKRAPPKPPPAPIEPHPSVPVSVEPNVVTPAAPGQKPPPKSDETWEDVPAQFPGYGTDILKGTASGLVEGTEGLLGLPTDLKHAADYGLDWAMAHVRSGVTGEDSKALIKQFQDEREAIPSSGIGMPGAAAIRGVVNKVLPMLDYKPQSAPGRYAHEFAAFAPGALIGGVSGIPARLASTVLPAIGSETLGHAVEGTWAEPWARLVGAGLGGLTHTGIESYTAPIFKGGQQDVAATQLRDRTSQPDEALAKIRATQAQTPPGRATGEDVPGSMPTTAQVTGDYKQVQAERAYQSGEGQAVHGQRMAEQGAAQTQAARGVQDTGNPQTVADTITKRLRDIDAQHEADIGIRQQVHEAHTRRLTGEAQAETGKVAKLGEPERLGEAAREALAASMAKAKERETRLWNAIDPHKKIGIVATKIGARARNIAKNIGYQKPMEGEEKAIFDAAAGLPKWTRLADVMDLSSRLKGAMRQERATNGTTPALKRMATLNTTIENIIANSASRASAAEGAAEREGLRYMTPADQKARQAASAATKARGNIERGPVGSIIKKGATSDSYRTISSQVPGKVFAAGPAGYQKAKAFAEASGKPWLDPFNDIVADSLAREATTDGMVDAAKLTKWQAKYRDALRALPDEVRQRYVRGPGEAGAALAEGAAQRRQALIAHSKRDVAKEMGKPDSAALRANPAFKGFEGVESPHDVQRVVGGILQRPDAVTRMGQLREHLAGTPAEEGLKRAVLDHVLEKTLSTAEAGTTGEKMLQPGGFQKFVANNRAVLKAAGLSDEQLATLDRVSGDLQRQQRFNATKVRAGSDTAQNQFASLKKIAESAHHGSGWLAPLLALKEAYEYVPESLHGVAGAVGAGAIYGTKELLKHYRNKGLVKAQDVYHEAIMNPDKAADLLSRPSVGGRARLGRHAMYAGLAAERHAALAQPGRDVYVNKAAAH